jgi:3-deoxy-D-manno-octulosonic-acid transferase
MLKLMKSLIRLLFIFEYLLHGLCTPVIFVLLPFFKSLRQRYRSEMLLNSKALSIKTEYTFEVSSEGEYEQIAPIMTYLLNHNITVQFIIGSESLIKKSEKLLNDYTSLLDVRMVPIISFFWIKTPITSNLFSLLQSEKLILCRYDFFPELMLIGGRRSTDFTLVSASLKNKKLTGVSKFYWTGIYSLFDRIVAASSLEKEHLSILHPEIVAKNFDFRQLQILDRIEGSNTKLNTWIHTNSFNSILEKFPREKRIIIGSCWEEECEILKNNNFVKDIENNEVLLVIAPHKLEEFNIDKLIKKIKEYSQEMPIKIIKDEKQLANDHQGCIYILQKSGILVELYQYFGHAFVGGGYGRSIHSVLEPFLSGCLVYCGPRTHRSTEFDLVTAKNNDQITIINNQENFSSIMKEKIEGKLNMAIIKRNELNQSFKEQINDLMEKA